MESFADGKRSVEVWLRPKDRHLPPGTLTQLFDVIVADAHISDSQLRGGQPGLAFDPNSLVSLDLSIQWTPFIHNTGWRRIQATSPPAAHGFSACTATIFDETGSVCAHAAQQTYQRAAVRSST
jgi:acyl-CoA thioesterase